ncbi:MAG: tRNA lysidine(34) synthetase TilS [Pseudomonadota bacterium]
MQTFDVNERFAALLAEHRLSPRRIAVGLSGGPDSCALLHALAADGRWRGQLVAWHVNHGLQHQANAWESLAREQSAALGLRCDVFRVTMPRQGDGPEDRARRARLAAFAAALGPGDIVVLGHHGDDQAETLLLNALRGAGARGLGAIPAVRPLGVGAIVRPMLGVGRAEVERFVASLGAGVARDPHNVSVAFDRSYLRERVMPVLAARWSDAGRRLASSAAHCRSDAERARRGDRAALHRALGTDGSLALGGLVHRDYAGQRALFRAWLDWAGVPPPAERRLASFLAALSSDRRDHGAELAWAGHWVRHYAARLYLGAAMPPVRDARLVPGRPLALGGHAGTLELTSAARGFAVPPEGLRITYRCGGEKIRLTAGRSQQSVKDLYRVARVLPWWRERLPLLFAADQLVAIADLWQRDDTDVATAYRLRWRDAPTVVAR